MSVEAVVWPEKQSQHPGALGQQRTKVRLFLWGGNAAEVYPLPVMKFRKTQRGGKEFSEPPESAFFNSRKIYNRGDLSQAWKDTHESQDAFSKLKL